MAATSAGGLLLSNESVTTAVSCVGDRILRATSDFLVSSRICWTAVSIELKIWSLLNVGAGVPGVAVGAVDGASEAGGVGVALGVDEPQAMTRTATTARAIS